ncbi:MAG: Inner membrane protein YbhL [Candidatus Omnitrophica bacterium]|nr:Inner membrane protein YbhL [Candidatus Omnitrophota bacterium]
MRPINTTPDALAVSESSFISKVFLWMAAGLGVSGAAALWTIGSPAVRQLVFGTRWALLVLIVAQLGLVFWLSARAMQMGAGAARLIFLAYSFLNGVTLSSIFLVYTLGSLGTTFAVASGTFLFFALYGLTTKKDLTSLGNLAVMGLIGVVIASVVNIFLKSPALMWISTFVGIAVFMGLIAWDTQKLKAIHAAGHESEDFKRKAVILGALALYLDFINLFILLLRIFGRQRD